jgi:hypothetical protein
MVLAFVIVVELFQLTAFFERNDERKKKGPMGYIGLGFFWKSERIGKNRKESERIGKIRKES